jgi:hypothetical protein
VKDPNHIPLRHVEQPNTEAHAIPPQRAEQLSEGHRNLLDWLVEEELKRWLRPHAREQLQSTLDSQANSKIREAATTKSRT